MSLTGFVDKFCFFCRKLAFARNICLLFSPINDLDLVSLSLDSSKHRKKENP